MIKHLPLIALAFLAPAARAQTAPAPTPAPTAGGLIVDVEGGISAPMGIAIPPMPTSEVVSTPAGPTDALGRQLADGNVWPNWYPTAEFRAVRDQSRADAK